MSRTPELIQLVRQTLSMDAEEEVDHVPDYYFAFVATIMRDCPLDLNILIEAGEPGDPSKGGQGFGIITCIEEDCFADIILTADNTKPNGGKDIGLGSIYHYKRHIQHQEHISSRNSRLTKEKREKRRILEAKASGLDDGTLRAFGACPSMAQIEQAASLSQQHKHDSEPEDEDELEDEVEEIARPRWAAIGQGAPSDMSDTEIEDSDAGAKNVKPIIAKNKGKGKPGPVDAIVLSSDDDDYMPIRKLPANTKRRREILPASSLGSDAMPINIDSDEDVKPIFGTPTSFKRQKQKQTTLNKYRSGVKSRDSDGDICETIMGTAAPQFGATGTPSRSQQDIKPTQAALYQPVQQFDEPRFPGHFGPSDVKPDYVRETKPAIGQSRPQPNFPPTWDGSLSPEEAGRRLQSEAKIILAPEVLRERPHMSMFINDRRKEIRDQVNRIREAAMGTLFVQVRPPSSTLLQTFSSVATLWPEEVNALRQRYEWQRKQLEKERIDRIEAVRRMQQVKHEAQMHIGGVLNPPILGNAVAGSSQAPYNPAYPNGHTPAMQPQFDLLAVADNEGELMRRSGPQLREDELSKFFEDSLNEFAEYETVSDAATKLGLASMDEALPSMKVKLMPHQVIGVAWMLDMERNAKRKGGILADSMGLGKTIQMIATMAENPSTSSKRKTTLVIAPLALLEQWKSEMLKFVNKKWRIHIYHGKGAKMSVATMKQYDVIITTFGQIIGALPGSTGSRKKKTESWISSDEEDDGTQRKGDLLLMNWYRVCVDEAAQIRNHKTKGARAIFQLHSTYRWILSGTLVVNTLADLFSPLYFLGISELSVWKTFRDKIKSLEKKRPDLAAKRLQAVLKYACLRRTATSQIDGKPILTLPEKTLVKRPGDFDPDERSVYDVIEARAIARFNKYLKANTVLKNYAHVLTMILRLRQICNSVSLVVRKPGEPGRPDDLLISEADLVRADAEAAPLDWTREGEMNRARAVGGDELVNKLIIKFEKRQADIEAADGADDEDSQEQALDEVDLECAVCYEAFGDDERVTACSHSYCVACMPGILNPTIARGETLCPMCREPLTASKVFVAAAFKPIDVKEEENVDELDLKVDMDLGENMPPSTKMQEVLQLVEGWRVSAPQDKILIFSQFVSMIDLLAAYLRDHDIDTSTYTGQMSKDDRDDTLEEFRQPDGPRVCIISTKAGGVGLNLVCANKVILLDHTWTYAATAQAVDRAWRIGQTKPVEVVELSIGNTIEQRILDLQAKKKQLADAAFGEGNGGKIGRLSLADLRMLFDRNA